MSFQWIINNATSFSIDNKKMVSTTIARDGTPRVVSRGTLPAKITVTLPDGIPWQDIKTDIAGAEALDRTTSATITIPFAVHPWYYDDVNPGTDDSYTVYCLEFPEWTIFGFRQVQWSGPFVFVENT